MKKTICAALAAALLAGCAITSSHHSGPNGRPVHYIDGMTASAAYSKASELCPYGYTILGNPEQKTAFDYVMTVECKGAAITQRPAETPRAAPSQVPSAKPARYSYTVEQMPESRACNPYPVARLDASGADFEKFTVLCTNRDALTVRCDSSGCRVLQ